jgi:hypothetical protein
MTIREKELRFGFGKSWMMLGLAHCIHEHIVRYGKERFCHRGSNLYFSSSDGSDPNTNGRAYSYCESF